METTKLYSEIEKIIDSKHTFSPHDTDRNCERAKLNTEIAQSIEQLFIDKMEGLADYISKEYCTCDFLQFGFEPLPDGILMSYQDKNKYTIKDVVKKYLNK